MRYVGYPLYTLLVLAGFALFVLTPSSPSSSSTQRSILGPQYRGPSVGNAPLTPFVPLVWPTTIYDRTYRPSSGGGGSYGGSGWGK
jgi:hypothetical protein